MVGIAPWVVAIVPSLLLFIGFFFAWAHCSKNYLGPHASAYEGYVVGGAGAAGLLSYFIIAGGQSGALRSLVRAVADWLNSSPWWKATVVFTLVGGVLSGLIKFSNHIVPDLEGHEGKLILPALIGTIFAYFAATAIFAMSMLREERRKNRRDVEEVRKQFESKKVFDSADGVLRNGDEISVAMRVPTVIHFFETLGAQLLKSPGVTQDHLAAIMHASGRGAGLNFGERLPQIHDDFVLRQGGGPAWRRLNLVGKLEGWFKYESENGLGKFTLEQPPPAITLRIQHGGGLLSGDGGLAFSHFLSGACAAVVEAILKEHNTQASERTWRDYNSVSFAHISRLVPADGSQPEYPVHTIELRYNLTAVKETSVEAVQKG
jgi:hypothetical protein